MEFCGKGSSPTIISFKLFLPYLYWTNTYQTSFFVPLQATIAALWLNSTCTVPLDSILSNRTFLPFWLWGFPGSHSGWTWTVCRPEWRLESSHFSRCHLKSQACTIRYSTVVDYTSGHGIQLFPNRNFCAANFVREGKNKWTINLVWE